MASLRSRLIFSHTLPALVIIPLIGIALVYILETQVILVNLSQQLTRQAGLLVQVTADYPEIWHDPDAAQRFVARFAPALSAQLMILTPDGLLLASSDPFDKAQEGKVLTLKGLATAQGGEVSVETDYNANAQADIVDVLAPVLNQPQQVVGLVRLTHIYATVYERFWRLRYFTIDVLLIGLLVGVGTGLFLALTLERPVTRLTTAIEHYVTADAHTPPLAEEGAMEIRVLIRAFNRLVSQLQEQESLRKRLLANLIHEIRRPLGALTSAVHALLHGASEEPALRSELLNGMTEEFQQLEHLTTDLLLLYEQAVGAIELDRRPTDLHEWLTTSLVHWRVAAQRKGLTWQVTIADQLPTLCIDPVRLGQVLGNLLSNAIKFTPAGGVITLGAGVTPDSFQLTITDSGPGIDPAEQGHIFEPFYRSQRTKRFAHGMGLGLTIARDLVNAHGGQLTVRSTPQHGSTFTLRLPLIDCPTH